MGEDDAIFFSRPRYYFVIRCSWISHTTPVRSLEAMFLESFYPKRGEVHIYKKSQAMEIGTSSSSSRQAA